MTEEELYKGLSEYLDENGVEAVVRVLYNVLKDYTERNKEDNKR
jgi:hypothetical protein